jgi:hypothetical protein
MASSWELHKDTLRTLYVDRDETLKSIMAHMRDVLGFTKRYGIHPVLRSLIKAANLATAKASTNDNSRNGASARIVQQWAGRLSTENQRAGEARQDERGSQKWQGIFWEDAHQREATILCYRDGSLIWDWYVGQKVLILDSY